MIKRFALIFVALLSTMSLFSSITLVSVKGTVQIKSSETASWKTPKLNQELKTGFFVYTGFDSSAIISTGSAKIEVKPLSQVSVASLLATSERVSTDVFLKYGGIKANVESSRNVQTVFKVRSANSTASVRGTVFEFGEDSLFVEEGTVQILSNDGFSALVQGNEKASAPKLSMLGTPLSNTRKSASVPFMPIGISQDERDQLVDFFQEKARGTAKVVINVTVR
jgi:hypothetical protein